MYILRNQIRGRYSWLSPLRPAMVIMSVLIFLLPTFDQIDLAYGVSDLEANRPVVKQPVERSNKQAFVIMQQQLHAYREQLQSSESELEAFQQKHGIISLETQIDLLLQQRKALDDSLKKVRNISMGYKEKYEWVKGQISLVPKEVPLSTTSSEQGVISAAKNNLLGLQLKEQQLLTKYTSASPHVQSVREEMNVIARFITEQEAKQAGSTTHGKNPLYREMEMQLFQTQADLISAEAQSEVIVKQIAEVDQELERFRGLRSGLDELRRQVTAAESNYLNYLTKVGTTPPQDYQVQVGDQLDFKFFFNPELNESVEVRPDGRIALQLVGEISIVGYTVAQIREVLIEKYAGQLKNPEVAVLLRSSHVLAGEASVRSSGQSSREHHEN
ncbi:MAG: hypothetical protein NPIRA04_25900 [Nitrospirales bacterium]|nr:MAG: hypothetical protein NPIRA04_25900 [Nitrospirales bacterium]